MMVIGENVIFEIYQKLLRRLNSLRLMDVQLVRLIRLNDGLRFRVEKVCCCSEMQIYWRWLS